LRACRARPANGCASRCADRGTRGGQADDGARRGAYYRACRGADHGARRRGYSGTKAAGRPGSARRGAAQ